jgi:hypothetical protein
MKFPFPKLHTLCYTLITTSVVTIVDKILSVVKEVSSDRPHEAALWKCLCPPHMRKEILDFLWQAIHGRTVCRTFIQHWGGEWAEKAICQSGMLESLDVMTMRGNEGVEYGSGRG